MKRLLTASIAALLFFVVKGQDVPEIIPEVIPPGPTAAELGRYGLVPVNMHTGNTNVSIPLHEFKTRNLSIPISLSYNSSAIHVDEVASWVGMHWSLNAGGVITRIVRDQPDVPPQIPYPEDFSMSDGMSFYYVLFNGENPDALDTEPDLFTYNFLGYTGKLIFDRDGTPVAIPRNDLVFEGSMIDNFSSGFTVTTPDGIKYSFEEEEKTSITGSGEGTYSIPTAWYLTKIEHPLGDIVELAYELDIYGYPLSTSSIVTKMAETPAFCGSGLVCPDGFNSSTVSYINVRGKMLTKIESVGHGSIIFQSSTGRLDIDDGHKLSSIDVRGPQGHLIKSFALDYVFSDNEGFDNPLAETYDEITMHRMFLTRVVQKDRLTKEINEFSFEYDDINALPARLSNARDHWGYFNGADNTSPFPETFWEYDYMGRLAFPGYNANREPNNAYAKKGLLKKIIYPTGGSSEFSYEGNTYYGTHTVYPVKTGQFLVASGEQEQYEDIVDSEIITSGVEQYAQLNITCNYKNFETSTYGHGKWIVYDQQGNPVDDGSIWVGESKIEYVRLLGGQQYTVAVIAEGPPPDGMWANNTITTLNIQYYASAPQTITENIETGGIRIATILAHDPVSGMDEAVRYHYARHDQLSESSGIRMYEDPNYVTRYGFVKPCLNEENIFICGPISCSYVALHSSGMNTLFQQNGNNVYYEYVTISRGTDMETGLEEHEFFVSPDQQGTLVWGTNDIPGTPMSNINWDNGLEKAIRYYKRDASGLKLVKAVENEYSKDNRYNKVVPGLSFRSNYWSDCHGVEIAAQIICDSEEVDLEGHPCYDRNVGDIIEIPTGLIHMVDAVEYLNISHWFYMSKQTLTTYPENGMPPIVQVTNYFYDNDAHTQLTRQVTTSSNGKSLEIHHKYAKDYEPVPGDAVELMADASRNMVGIPIEQIQKVEGLVTAASATNFDVHSVFEDDTLVQELIVTKDIYSYETALPGIEFVESTDGKDFGSYTQKATIHRYDDDGNILEVSKEGDMRISYIWGYGDKYPVAKVENAAYSSIPIDIINDIKLKSAQDNDHCDDNANCQEKNLRLSLDALRNVLSHAMITTYTYDPPIGVTSITDPNNITTYYEYDNFGRLWRIKDNEGNILKEYEYNYQVR